MWCFLPPEEIVEMFYKSLEPGEALPRAIRGRLPEVRADSITYKLLPISREMEDVVIFRDERPDRPKGAHPQESDYRIHLYPFSEIEIRTHADPKLMVYEAGRTIQKLLSYVSTLDRTYAGTTYPRLVKMLREIYLAWNRDVPDDHRKDRSYDPPNEPSPAEDTSTRTRGARAPCDLSAI